MVTSDFFYSQNLEMDWIYTAVLPEGFDKEKKYDVIILLHGTNGNNRTLVDRVPLWEIMKDHKDKIVILPNGFNTYYIGKMEKAIMEDLIAFIMDSYNVNNIILGGVSMGAFGALRLSLKYPDMFSNILLISPAIWNQVPPKDSGVRNMSAFGSPFNDETWKNNSWYNMTENLSKNNYIVVHGNEDEIVNKDNVLKFTNYCIENNINIDINYVTGNHNSLVVIEGIKIALKQI